MATAWQEELKTSTAKSLAFEAHSLVDDLVELMSTLRPEGGPEFSGTVVIAAPYFIRAAIETKLDTSSAKSLYLRFLEEYAVLSHILSADKGRSADGRDKAYLRWFYNAVTHVNKHLKRAGDEEAAQGHPPLAGAIVALWLTAATHAEVPVSAAKEKGVEASAVVIKRMTTAGDIVAGRRAKT